MDSKRYRVPFPGSLPLRREPGTFFFMKQWSPVVHQVYRTLREGLKETQFQGETWLVMFSGGMDSVSLLEILLLLKNSLGIQLGLFHLHHGPGSEKQKAYRDQALQFSQEMARRMSLPFYYVQSEELLSSEAEMRSFRRQQIRTLRVSVPFERVVFGHHQDDFLETQLMRMIRGAGPEASLSPMKICHNMELRPLLKVSRACLRKFVESSGVNWLEDPSNQDPHFLRNWLRNEWLVSLECKCPGALNSFSRSLDLLSEMMPESHMDSLPSDIWLGEDLSRPDFLTLSPSQKSQCLAQYIRQQGGREFNHNQIKEILKHLDISKVEHMFNAAQMTWTLSREMIVARPDGRKRGS